MNAEIISSFRQAEIHLLFISTQSKIHWKTKFPYSKRKHVNELIIGNTKRINSYRAVYIKVFHYS